LERLLLQWAEPGDALSTVLLVFVAFSKGLSLAQHRFDVRAGVLRDRSLRNVLLSGRSGGWGRRPATIEGKPENRSGQEIEERLDHAVTSFT
jgi:hypothetical protein